MDPACETARMDVPDRVAAQELGNIAHGPMLIAADKGIVVGVRCVFAHSTGLHLPIVLVARGVNADAARRRLREHGDELRLTLGPSGTAQVRVTAFATQSASSEDEYRQESAYWYSGLPDSATLSLTVSWPEIGLPTTAAVLEVPNLATLARGALPLL